MARQLHPEIKLALADLLNLEGLAKTHAVKHVAALLGPSERTIWRIKAEGNRAGDRPRKRGPKRVAAECFKYLCDVVEGQLEGLGWNAGEGALMEELGEDFSRRLVRRALRVLKRRKKRKEAAAKVARRFRFTAHAQGVLWCLDEAQLAPRRRPKDEVFVEVLRDPATRMILTTGAAPPATGEAAVAWLRGQFKEQGFAPLVISMDNGPAYKSDVLQDFLKEHQIVALRNLPYTPQHNAHAERAVKEIKAEMGIKKGRLKTLRGCLTEAVKAAVKWLNFGQKRGVLAGRTAAAAAREMPVAERVVDRARFFSETCSAIEQAVQGCVRARARRLAERKAIFESLAHFQLVTITRGGKDAANLNTVKTR